MVHSFPGSWRRSDRVRGGREMLGLCMVFGFGGFEGRAVHGSLAAG